MLPPELLLAAGDGRRIEIREIEHAVIEATPYVRERLERADESMFMIEQLVTYGADPLYVRVGYYPGALPDISSTVIELDRRRRIPSAPEAFEEIYGVPFGGHESVFEAVPCEARTSRLLGIPEGSPILLREMVVRDVRGVPWELSYTHYRGDIHTIVAESDVC
jgi:GntR family transcriptional regulator